MESNPLLAADAALRAGDLARADSALATSLPEHVAEAALSLGLAASSIVPLLRARLLRKQSDLDGALAYCERLLADHPSSVPVLVLSIDLAKRCGRDELAARCLRDVRAYCMYENARVDDLSLDALEATPPKLRLVAIRAQSWFNARAYAHVQAELERVADRYALVSPAWRRLIGWWLYASAHGDSWKRLEEHARSVLAIDPELVSARDALAYALGKQGRSSLAEAAFVQAGLPELLARGGDSPLYSDWISHAPAAALSPVAQTTTERDLSSTASADFASLLLGAHPDGAELASLVTWRDLGPTPRQAFLFVAPACAYEHRGGWLAAVAELFLGCGRFAECVRVFERAIAIARQHQAPDHDLGRMLAVLGGALVAHDVSRANAVFEQAHALLDAEREPGIVAALELNWGALCMDLGRLTEAARRFSQAAKLAPSAHTWIATVNVQHTLLDIERGETQAAVEKARGAEQAFDIPVRRGGAVAAQGFAHLCARQDNEAREQLDRAQLFLRDTDPRQAARVDCYRAVANATTMTPEEHRKLFESAEAVLDQSGDRHGLVIAAVCRHLVLDGPLPDLQTGPIEARLLVRRGS